MVAATRFLSRITQRKALHSWLNDSVLKKCMNTFDLTFLGVGSVVDAGLYIVLGQLARDVAGPSVVVAVLIATVTVSLSSVCFAEFITRVPKTGSSYVFLYLSMGEIFAFVAGWMSCLNLILSVSVLAKGCSIYINSLVGGEIFEFFITHVADWKISVLARFPDFLALAFVVVTNVIVGLGVHHTRNFVNFVTFINLAVILFIVTASTPFLDASNWSGLEKFAPNGASGILTAATMLVFGFSGIDALMFASEEALEPVRSIPKGILYTFIVSFIAYFAVATVLTMMVPYTKLDESNPGEAFSVHSFPAAKIVISIGALCAMSSSLTSCAYCAPRVFYSMACDRLLFKCLATVSKRFHVPINAVLLCGFLSGAFVLFVNISKLVELVSLASIVNYILVAIAVVLTRHQGDVQSVNWQDTSKRNLDSKNDGAAVMKNYLKLSEQDVPDEDLDDEMKEPIKGSQPDFKSSRTVTLLMAIVLLMSLGLCLLLSEGWLYLSSYDVWAVVLFCVFTVVLIISLILIRRQPVNGATFPIMVPFVPWIPTLSIFANCFLLVKISYWTYVIYIIWMSFGMLVYFLYSYKNSFEGNVSLLKNDPSKQGQCIATPNPPFGKKAIHVQDCKPDESPDLYGS